MCSKTDEKKAEEKKKILDNTMDLVKKFEDGHR